MRAYLIYMDGVYERGLSPTLVLDLDVVVVVFKLDDLYLILVSCPPIPWLSRIWTTLGM